MEGLSSPAGFQMSRSLTSPTLGQARRVAQHRQPRRRVSSKRSHASSIPDRPNSSTESIQDATFRFRDTEVVEKFAERVDRYQPPSQDLSTAERTEAAVGLVREFRTIADEQLRQLQSTYEHDLLQQTRSDWRRQISIQTQRSAKATCTDEDIDQEALDEISRWQAEYDTWRLCEDLFAVRHPETTLSTLGAGLPPNIDQGNDRFAADGETFQSFVTTNIQDRERLIVCKWLEESTSCSRGDTELLEEELEDWSDRGKALWTSSFMDTRERLKSEKRLRLWNTSIDGLPSIVGSDGNLIVQQLDPDASSRLQRAPDVGDTSFEAAFWRVCLEKLRQGQSMTEMLAFCERCNQHALAAMLGACLATSDQVDDQAIAIARYRWRIICNTLASQRVDVSDAPRAAVMGLLGGNAEALEPFCKDWKDRCYSVLNAQLLSNYQAFIRSQLGGMLPHGRSHSLDKGVYGGSSQSISDTIYSVTNDRAFRTTSSPCSNLFAIQIALLSNDLERLIEEQGGAIAQSPSFNLDHSQQSLYVQLSAAFIESRQRPSGSLDQDPQALRVIAHLHLLLEYLNSSDATGSGSTQQCTQNVPAAYAEHLIKLDRWLLVPAYASNLHPDLAARVMGVAMRKITKDDQREQTVQLMKDRNMDIFSVFKQHTQETLRQLRKGGDRLEPSQVPNLCILKSTADTAWPGKRIKYPQNNPMTDAEEAVIASANWYLIQSDRWAETFEIMLRIAENFLILGKLDAAFSLSIQLSPPIIAGSLGRLDIFTPEHDPSAEELSMQQQGLMYLHCSVLSSTLGACWDWSLKENELNRATSNPIQGKEIRHQGTQAMEDLKIKMEVVLSPRFLMPPKKKPSDIFPTGPAEQLYAEHAHRLQAIREAYLPELVLAYNSALTSAGRLLARDHFITSLELGKTIAENEEVLRCFRKAGRMRELVDALATTSLRMLELNQDRSQTSKQRGKTGKTLGIWDIRT